MSNIHLEHLTPPLRWPAEWERHRATWIAWPHEATDFPDKLHAVQWVYAEIVRHLSKHEVVEILCHNEEILAQARSYLTRSGITENVGFHLHPSDRSWLRDSAPTAIENGQKQRLWIQWHFNGWAKYKNHTQDNQVPHFVAQQSKLPLVRALRTDRKELAFVLEGGAIDGNGAGTLLTTRECLLSEIQERNPGLSQSDYEALFAKYLGIRSTIWLAGSCEGDDTHGHVDDVARFVAPHKVLLAYAEDPSHPDHAVSSENLAILQEARTADGGPLEIIKLPVPSRLQFDGYTLPASYANFYIANQTVLMPTFNDPMDRKALEILAGCFPSRTVVGIHAVDLVLGLGTLHCLTQQEPC
jgi:agmatine deiminase